MPQEREADAQQRVQEAASSGPHTSCRFMPKPSPTTDACSSQRGSFPRFPKWVRKAQAERQPQGQRHRRGRKAAAATSKPSTNTIFQYIRKGTYGPSPGLVV